MADPSPKTRGVSPGGTRDASPPRPEGWRPHARQAGPWGGGGGAGAGGGRASGQAAGRGRHQGVPLGEGPEVRPQQRLQQPTVVHLLRRENGPGGLHELHGLQQRQQIQ